VPGVTRRSVMSALSTAATLPIVPSSPSIAEAAFELRTSAADENARLIELGRLLDPAAASEKALWEKSKHQVADDFQPLREILSYRADNETDREVARLLCEHGWEDGYSFNPRDIDDLRHLAKTGDAIVDGRVGELIEANDRFMRLRDLPEAVSLFCECEAANGRTLEIIHSIEAEHARTLQGLIVKAKAVIWCWGGEFDAEGPDHRTTDVRILYTIIKDLIAIAEKQTSQITN
jgi:hypothetical protein